jgi:hypothetical protein
VQEAKLLGTDAASLRHFGSSVSITEDYVVIGAPRTSVEMINTGAAYVFQSDGTHWHQVAKIFPSDGWRTDLFGFPVALRGANLVVGASRHDGVAEDSGAAYHFRLQGDRWIEVAKLLPLQAMEDSRIGLSVGVSEDNIIVGGLPGATVGATYVYPLAESSPDCNDNGVPDECETDCNDNGIPDDCDIAVGSSDDVNDNAVPDECETVRRVDMSSNGINNGSSWVDAYTHLQDAIAAAKPGDEIWVAAGTYRPATSGGDRNATFTLPDVVGVYGGFAGWESRRGQRDPTANITILSGDLNNDDRSGVEGGNSDCCTYHYGQGCDSPECEEAVCTVDPSCCTCCWEEHCAAQAAELCCELCFNPTKCDNSHRVVTALNVNDKTTLDGFTITGGHAMVPDINWTTDSGGGLYQDRSRAQITNCTFVDNTASHGGAVYNFRSEPNISNCTFSANHSGEHGGAIVNWHSDTVVTDCVFQDNSSQEGGAFFNQYSAPVLTRCVFSANAADINGGAVSNKSSRFDDLVGPRFVDCSFLGNAAWLGGAMHNHAGTGNDRTNPVIINCDFIENSALWLGGAVLNDSSTGSAVVNATFVNCRFLSNRASSGGGMYNDTGTGSATTMVGLRNCTFSGNYSDEQGGGMYNSGGISLSATSVTLVNCTLTENVASGYGGAVYNTQRGLSLDLANSILWGNRDMEGNGESCQLHNYCGEPILTIDYNNIQGWTGALGGTGNIGDDPLFVDPDGPDDIVGTLDDDLRVLRFSPVINSGSNDAILEDTLDLDGDGDTSEPTPIDLDGHARILCGIVDMGAYEFGIGDHDCDQSIDLADFAAWDGCMTGPDNGPYDPECEPFDFEYDLDIDLNDFAGFARALTSAP